MARYIKDIVLHKPENTVRAIVNDFMVKNNFVMSQWKGEPAYRTGDVMIEGYKYFKWSYENGVFHMEAWIRGTFGGEWDLDGFVGSLAKKAYKQNLNILEEALKQEWQFTGDRSPFDVQFADNATAANKSLVLGIVSIVVSLIVPVFRLYGAIMPLVALAGAICGMLGFTYGKMGNGSSKNDIAKVGRILSIIGTIIGTVVIFYMCYRIFFGTGTYWI